MLVKLDHFPKDRVEDNKKKMKPPPRSNIIPFLVDSQIGLPSTVFRMHSSSKDSGTHKELGNIDGSSARSFQRFLKINGVMNHSPFFEKNHVTFDDLWFFGWICFIWRYYPFSHNHGSVQNGGLY